MPPIFDASREFAKTVRPLVSWPDESCAAASITRISAL